MYPAVDVLQQLRQMRAWLVANPAKRKTKQGINAFVVRWLSKEQDRGGAAMGNKQRIRPDSAMAQKIAQMSAAYKADMAGEIENMRKLYAQMGGKDES